MYYIAILYDIIVFYIDIIYDIIVFYLDISYNLTVFYVSARAEPPPPSPSIYDHIVYDHVI